MLEMETVSAEVVMYIPISTRVTITTTTTLTKGYVKNSVRKQSRKIEHRKYAGLMENLNVHCTRESQRERERVNTRNSIKKYYTL